MCAAVPSYLALVKSALLKQNAASSDFDLNPDVNLSPDRRLRPAGVLVAIWREDDTEQVILTKRSSALKHHPGQIAFAGGKKEKTDADATAAALREASEEIGLDPENVKVLGLMPPHETVTGFIVTPVVGRVLKPFNPIAEAGEVDEVFKVPLSHLMNTCNYSVQHRYWRGSPRYYYAIPYGPYYIWGATARILRAIAEAADVS